MRVTKVGVGGAFLFGALMATATAHAEIAMRESAERTEESVAPGDYRSCVAMGGVWVADPPHCEISDASATDGLAWDWNTFGDADADRAVKVASAWRSYFEERTRAPKLYVRPFLLTTGAFVTKVDAALARAAKADAADKASKDPRAPKRSAARARAVAVWAALRADVVAVEAAVRKKLPTPPRPAAK